MCLAVSGFKMLRLHCTQQPNKWQGQKCRYTFRYYTLVYIIYRVLLPQRLHGVWAYTKDCKYLGAGLAGLGVLCVLCTQLHPHTQSPATQLGVGDSVRLKLSLGLDIHLSIR